MNNNPGKLDLSKARPDAPAAPESPTAPSRPGAIRITASQAEALAAGPKKRRASILRPLLSLAVPVLLAAGLYATRALWLPAAQSALGLVRDRLDAPVLPPAEIPETPLDDPAPTPEPPATPAVPSVPVPEVPEVPVVPSVPSSPFPSPVPAEPPAPPAPAPAAPAASPAPAAPPRSPEFQAAARLFNQALADFRTFSADPTRTDLLPAIEERAVQAAKAFEALPPSAAPGENIPALISQCYRLVSDARSRHLANPAPSTPSSSSSKIKTAGPRRRPALPAYTPPSP